MSKAHSSRGAVGSVTLALSNKNVLPQRLSALTAIELWFQAICKANPKNVCFCWFAIPQACVLYGSEQVRSQL